jgi:Raf kinase inhibitor-like YbhB/YbcL family protein
MRLTSSAFEHNAAIPSRYTCEGDDVTPPLAWSEVPEGTRSFALIVDDPDAPDPAAPKVTWVRWVVYNLPPTLHRLTEAMPLPALARVGRNDWHHLRWGGPCPPIGRHRYFFKLYALDTLLPELTPPTKATLEAAMKNHVIGAAELIGTYERQRP